MRSSEPPFADAGEVLARYEAIRTRLPIADYPDRYFIEESLGDLADRFDVFVLDAFGVLNIGSRSVPGAVERIADLRARSKHVFVLTNGATYPPAHARAKLNGLGFDFTAEQIVASRDAALEALAAHPETMGWGVAAPADAGVDDMAARAWRLTDEDRLYREADGFLLLSSLDWPANRQRLLAEALQSRSRPVIVANPDLVAPRETGLLSREPGHFAHQLLDLIDLDIAFCGKPFPRVFDLVRERLPASVDPRRVAMVGDTLHTDILGGAAAGWRTVLMTDFGLLRGRDIAADIARTGIVPDFVVARP